MFLLFGRRKKALRELDELWRSMEMSCENNYKDMAHKDLKDFEHALDFYFQAGILTVEDYSVQNDKLENKRAELRNFSHRQHIGW